MKKALVICFLVTISHGLAFSQKILFAGKKPIGAACTTLLGDLMFAKVDTTPGRNVADNYKAWENGDTILVKFFDNSGSPAMRQRIMRYAKEWELYGNITLKFVTDYAPVTNIRVKLGSKFDSLGHNSLVGVDCNKSPQTKQTMNLDTSDFFDADYYVKEIQDKGPFYQYLVNKNTNFDTYTYSQLYADLVYYPSSNKKYLDNLMRGTTLHEFGHALGLLHEQSFPGAIKWNRDTIYKHYWQNYHWAKAKVDFNVLETSDQFFTNGTVYDPKSIMHYSVESWQTTDGYSLVESNEISQGDKNIIAALYPKYSKVSALAVPKVIISNFTRLEVKNDDVAKTLLIRPTFDIKTGAKLANAYFVARLTTEDGMHYLSTTSTLYNWGGYAATYARMNLLPNTKASYNNLVKNLELNFPYDQMPDLKGKNFKVEFTVYQDNAASGKLDKLVYYSLSSPLSIVR
ncbi:MAG: hypothetical protein E6H07_00430 [Bacteroidetes bacterium]|nr:MAG: hypothetical protein E6H07_00430 [Bacteroidota bacterium]